MHKEGISAEPFGSQPDCSNYKGRGSSDSSLKTPFDNDRNHERDKQNNFQNEETAFLINFAFWPSSGGLALQGIGVIGSITLRMHL